MVEYAKRLLSVFIALLFSSDRFRFLSFAFAW